jgi:hypothetical protein
MKDEKVSKKELLLKKKSKKKVSEKVLFVIIIHFNTVSKSFFFLISQLPPYLDVAHNLIEIFVKLLSRLIDVSFNLKDASIFE